MVLLIEALIFVFAAASGIAFFGVLGLVVYRLITGKWLFIGEGKEGTK